MAGRLGVTAGVGEDGLPLGLRLLVRTFDVVLATITAIRFQCNTVVVLVRILLRTVEGTAAIAAAVVLALLLATLMIVILDLVVVCCVQSH